MLTRVDEQAGIWRHYLRGRQIALAESLFDALKRHVGKEALWWIVESAVACGEALELTYPETKAPSVHRLPHTSIVRPLP
jgi:hypothetical protein